MERELTDRVDTLNERLCNCETLFDYAAKKQQVTDIETAMSAPGFWNNQEKAQATVGQLKGLNAVLKPIEKADRAVADLQTMVEMGEEDASFAEELRQQLPAIEQLVDEVELQSLLSGPFDAAGAIMTFHARDGGTDANDWAEMLLRMYTMWASKNGYEVELLDRQDQEQAGIIDATIAVRGPMAYGYLKGEHGIHRLVRISPFNAEAKRQTSFAAIDVTPEVADDIDIEIDWENDVREETMRAGGAGGQHVNKTSSAIRLTHIPTGTAVKCQAERSQHKNRATAKKMLMAALVRQEEEKREQQAVVKRAGQAKVGFGSQIRNYFQHPDQRVKDARTGYYMGNFQAVLDGDIQGFLDAYLRLVAKGEMAGEKDRAALGGMLSSA